jgi:hypothetical protein
MNYCCSGGGLVEDMEQCLRSLGRLLRSEFALYGWHQSFEKSEGQEDSWVNLKIYPANWDVPGLGPVHLRVAWYNTFVSDPADRPSIASISIQRSLIARTQTRSECSNFCLAVTPAKPCSRTCWDGSSYTATGRCPNHDMIWINRNPHVGREMTNLQTVLTLLRRLSTSGPAS